MKESIESIRELLHLKTPINIEDVISQFREINVLYGQYLDDDLIVKTDKSGDIYTIRIKPNKGSLTIKDKYLISIEFGHIMLGHIDKYKKDYYLYNNELSYFAEEYARELLMPEKEFRRVVYENSKDGVCDLIKVANYFKVDPEKVSVRGVLLKILKFSL